MVEPYIRKVVLIGAGKLATKFGIACKETGFDILQVYNRTPTAGEVLATTLSSEYINDLRLISADADLYCIAVTDSVIEDITSQLHLIDKPVVHFSGTLDIDVLKSCSHLYGALYPPQTFLKDSVINFKAIPFCIEANCAESETVLRSFASSLSDNVITVTFQQRKIIHLSAIFASNFTNLMYSISEQLLKTSGLSMNLLQPLIKQTALNASCEDIFGKQTGPAIREDFEVIQTHLELLANDPEYKTIYQLLSDQIIKQKYREG